MRMRISFDPKILCIIFEAAPPILPAVYGVARSSDRRGLSMYVPMFDEVDCGISAPNPSSMFLRKAVLSFVVQSMVWVYGADR